MLELNITIHRLLVGLCVVLASGLLFFSVSADDGSLLIDSGIPLMQGAKIINEKKVPGGGRMEFEISATPEQVARFYKKAMQQRGWPAGKVLSMGGQSMLMLKHQGGQFILRAESRKGKVRVVIALIQKTLKIVPKAVNIAQQKAAETKNSKIPQVLPKDDTGQPVNLLLDLTVADNRLEMFALTINTDNTLELDQPLVISFSQLSNNSVYSFAYI